MLNNDRYVCGQLACWEKNSIFQVVLSLPREIALSVSFDDNPFDHANLGYFGGPVSRNATLLVSSFWGWQLEMKETAVN